MEGDLLAAMVSDSGVTVVSWQWASSARPDRGFVPITSATNASYTPQSDDHAYFLRATVTYSDSGGPNKTAEAVTSLPVGVSEVTFMKNTGRTARSGNISGDHDQVNQAVYSGDNPAGYLLTDVVMYFSDYPADEPLEVWTRGATESGFGSLAFEMSLVSSGSGNSRTFEAPPGTVLDPGKVYYLRAPASSGRFGYTRAALLDSGAASGWHRPDPVRNQTFVPFIISDRTPYARVVVKGVPLLGPPGPPLNVQAAAYSTGVDVSWSPPGSTGHRDVSRYQVRHKKTSETDFGGWSHVADSDGDSDLSDERSVIISSLDVGVDYDVQVRAINSHGSSAEATAVRVQPVTFSADQAVVGTELTATLEISGATGGSWQWSRSTRPDSGFTNISGATAASYEPVDDDHGNFLRASATFTGADGPNRTAASVTLSPVDLTTTNVLKNTRKTSRAVTAVTDARFSQGIRSGDNPTGYLLKRVSVYTGSYPRHEPLEVWTRGAGESGFGSLAFKMPLILTDENRVAFDAPPGAVIDSDTVFYLRLPAFTGHVETIQTSSVDSGAGSGWGVPAAAQIGDFDYEWTGTDRYLRVSITSIPLLAPPDPPANVSTVAAGGGLVVSWTAPASVGHRVAKYQTRHKKTSEADSAFSAWSDVADSDGDGDLSDEGSVIVGVLDVGVEYTVEVRAVSSAGQSAGVATTGTAATLGLITFSDELSVDVELTATLLAAGVTATTWEWQSSKRPDGPFTPISGATEASYTPVDDDHAYFLKAIATYADGDSSGKTVEATTALPVGVARITLVANIHRILEGQSTGRLNTNIVQRVTSGDSFAGYVVTNVGVGLNQNYGSPITMQLRIGDTYADLQYSGSTDLKDVTWVVDLAAPPGTVLEPNTQFAIHLNNVANTHRTNSGHDGGGASGWSIENRSTVGGSGHGRLRVRVRGVELLGPPGPPLSVAAVAGPGLVELSWLEPGSTGHRAVERYQTRYKMTSEADTEFSVWSDVVDSDNDNDLGDERSVVIFGLDVDTEYTVEVRAMNSEGVGSSAAAQATPSATVSVAISGNTAVNPAVTAALSDPTATGVMWQWSSSKRPDGPFTPISGATEASYTPTTQDDAHFLRATASYSNSFGPQTPESVTLLPVGGTAINLIKNTGQTWRNLAGTQRDSQGVRSGDNPAGYLLTRVLMFFTQYPADQGLELWAQRAGQSGFGSKVFELPLIETNGDRRTFEAPPGTVLDPGTIYYLRSQSSQGAIAYTSDDAADPGVVSGWRVWDRVLNQDFNVVLASGNSIYARFVVQGLALLGPPGPPLSVAAVAGAGSAELSWLEPGSTGHRAVEMYETRYKKTSEADTEFSVWSEVEDGSDTDTDLADERSVTIAGLEGGVEYTLQVRAVNDEGDGTGAETKATPDDAPVSVLSIADVTVDESDSAEFTVSLTPVAAAQVTVDWTTNLVNDINTHNATAADFTAVSGMLTFLAGETSKTITVPVTNDRLDEWDEVFTVVLSNASAPGGFDGDATSASATGTITDNDVPVASINRDADVSEGDRGSFTVSLDIESSRDLTIIYGNSNNFFSTATPGANCTVEGADFVDSGADNSLVVVAGSMSAQFEVTTCEDTIAEVDESYRFGLIRVEDPAGEVAGDIAPIDRHATSGILDDEPRVVVDAAVSVAEDASSVMVPVRLLDRDGNPATSTEAVTMTFSTNVHTTAVHSATAGVSTDVARDYTTVTNGMATIAAGQSSGSAVVSLNDDTTVEDPETFVVTATAVSANAHRGGFQSNVLARINLHSERMTIAVVTITDDDDDEDQAGAVTIDADEPATGTALTAMLADPDGGVTDEEWQWQRSKRPDGGFEAIDLPANGSNTATYTPQSGDDAYFLRATVEYTDDGGSGKIASSVTSLPVDVPEANLMKNTRKTWFEGNLSGAHASAGVHSGDNPAGYLLRKVTTYTSSHPAGEPLAVWTRGSGETGFGSLAFEMRLVSSLSKVNTFEAPRGTVLDPDTVYYIRSPGGTAAIQMARTSDVDPGAASGWQMSGPLRNASFNEIVYGSGSSYPRVSISGVLLLGEPGPPLSVAAEPGDGSVELSWLEPGSTGHRDVIRYETRYKKTSEADTEFSDWSEVEDGSDAGNDLADERSVTISGLDAGAEYTLEVRAVNDEGDGTSEHVMATSTESTASVLSIADAVVVESDSDSVMAEFTVTMTPAAVSEVTVAWATGVNGVAATDATAADFEAGSGTLTFDAGETSKTITVTVTGDRLDEWDEVFTVVLSNASGPAGFDGGVLSVSATGTITDNDVPVVSYSHSDYDVSEGEPTVSTVVLDIASSRDLTVFYIARSTGNATPGTSCSAGVDYMDSGSEGSVVVLAGSTSAEIMVATCEDTVAELDKRFSFGLVRVEDPNGDIAGSRARMGSTTLHHLNDDEPRVVVDAAVSVGEGASSVMVPVRLVDRDGNPATSEEAVTVTFSTGVHTEAVHSATAGTSSDATRDYTAVTGGSATITRGQSSGSAEVALNDDTTVEDAETFVVTATAVSANAHLGGFVSDLDAAVNLHSTVMLVGVVTITDNDGETEANSPPAFPDSNSDGTADPVSRTVAENVTAGDLTPEIIAVDVNDDTLAYSVVATSDADGQAHLTAFTRDFELDTATGLISVKSDAMIDFEALASYVVTYEVTDSKDSTGADEATPTIDDTVRLTINVTNIDEAGVVTFDADPTVGTGLVARLDDPDDGVTVWSWQWQRSKRPDRDFVPILSDTDESYTPNPDDHAYFLRATATYADTHNSGNTVGSVTLLPVGVSEVNLLKNTRQGLHRTPFSTAEILNQEIRSGDNPAGYLLKQVTVYSASYPQDEPLEVWTRGTPGAGESFGSLAFEMPLVSSSGETRPFEPPPGTVLDSGTDYYLRLPAISGVIHTTGSSGGDSGAGSGWGLSRHLQVGIFGHVWSPPLRFLRVSISGVPLLGPPGPPLSVAAVPGVGSVELSWSEPGSTGHRDVERYRTRYKKTSEADTEFSAWLEVPDSDSDGDFADERSVTIAGLEGGVEYTLEVRAVNSEGDGTAAEAKATPTESTVSVLSIADAVVVESDSDSVMAEFTVSMTPAAVSEVTVAWTTGVNGVAATDATAADFEAGSGTLTFDAGETSKTITVTVTGDRLDEWDEVFTVVLSNASGPAGFAGDATSVSATGTITDNDEPVASWADENVLHGAVSVAEGETASFTVNLDIMSSRDLTVIYDNRLTAVATATPGASCSAGVDYVDSGADHSLEVVAGSMSAQFEVATCENTDAETDRDFVFDLLRIEDSNGGIVGSDSGDDAWHQILDDEPRVVVDAAVSVAEGASSVMVPVRLVGRDGSAATSAGDVTVTFSTGVHTEAVHSATGAASSDVARDYTAVTNGTVTITAGQSSASAEVSLNDDTTVEDSETFVVTATAVSTNVHLGGFVSDLNAYVNLHSTVMVTGVVTITDNDEAAANSPPAFPDSNSDGTADPVEFTVAENVTSGDLTPAITAEDVNDDTLAYSVVATSDSDGQAHLTAFTRDFELNTTTGLISVKSDAMIDFEALASYVVTYQVTDSKDSTDADETTPIIDDTVRLTINVTDVDEPGAVTIDMVGTAWTATLDESDAVIGTPTWQWQRSGRPDDGFMPIDDAANGSNTATYRPQSDDRAYFLRVIVTYTDTHSSKTASATTSLPVGGRADNDLMKNTLKSSRSLNLNYRDSQEVRSGDNPAGYLLTRVLMFFSQYPADRGLEVWTRGPGQNGYGSLAFEMPFIASASGGRRTFEAPPGTVLDPDTVYYLRPQSTGGTIGYTTSSGVDSGAASGWSVSNAFRDEDFDRIRITSGPNNGLLAYARVVVKGLELLGPPGPPENVMAAPGDGSVELSWEPPGSTGQRDVIRYETRYKKTSEADSEFSDWLEVPDSDNDGDLADERSVIISSLENRVEYTLQVRAVNSVAPGAGAEAKATPLAPNSPPTFADTDSDGTADPVEHSVEENVTSDDLTPAITAEDAENDTLTYSVGTTSNSDGPEHLAAFTRDFELDTAAGLISVKAAAMIDFETRASYVVSYRVSDNKNADHDTDPAIDDSLVLTITVTDVDEAGVVTFDAVPALNMPLTATLVDPDNPVVVTSWQWQRSGRPDGGFEDITDTVNGSNTATYTPDDDDHAYFLRAIVTYNDTHGSGKTVMLDTSFPVGLSSVLLMKNTLKDDGSRQSGNNARWIQSFRSGDNPGGYELASVEVWLGTNNAQAPLELKTLRGWGTTIETIPWESSRTDGRRIFVSTSDTVLEPDEDYGVRHLASGRPIGRITTELGVDSQSKSGWDIDRFATTGPGSTVNNRVLSIVVRGVELLGPAGPPKNVTAVPGVRSVELSWDEPGSTGHRPVIRYETRYKKSSEADTEFSAWLEVPDDDNDGDLANEESVTIAGLDAGAEYTLQVRAENSYTAERRAAGSEEPGTPAEAKATPISNSPPVFVDTNSDGTADPVERTVTENVTSGDLSPAITANDEDDVTLAYSVTATSDADGQAHFEAFTRDFELDAATGLISVKSDAMIDFEALASYVVTYQVTDSKDPLGADEATPTIDNTVTLTINVTNADDPGVVTFNAAPKVGIALTATLVEPDTVTSGTATWQWAKAKRPDDDDDSTPEVLFEDISDPDNGSNTATYTPQSEDRAYFLRATVTYTDNFGANKTAESDTLFPVLLEETGDNLIKNTGIRPLATVNTAYLNGHEVRSGDNPAGYVLTRVLMFFSQYPADGDLEVWTRRAGQSSGYGSFAFEMPLIASSSDRRTFDAPPGTVLDPGTTYYLRSQAGGGSMGHVYIKRADAGAAPGWELGRIRFRDFGTAFVNGNPIYARVVVKGAALLGPAGPPQNVTAAAGGRSVELSWDPPGSTGQRDVIRYETRYKKTSEADTEFSAWLEVPDSDNDLDLANERSVTISGLDAGVEYTLEVRAENSYTVEERAAGSEEPGIPAEAKATPTDTENLVLTNVPVSVTEDDTTGDTFTVALTTQPSADVTVSMVVGGEVVLSPATMLTFTTANWGTAQTVTVTATHDEDTVNDTETIVLTASGGGYGSVTGSVAVTVTDDEVSVLSIADVVVVESDSSPVMAEFTVSLAPAAAAEVTVDWTTGVDSDIDTHDATVDTDFTAVPGTLTFDAGETSKTVTVLVTGDRLDEWDEVFTVVLSNASGPAGFDGGVASVSATGTITDNDEPVVSISTDTSVSEGGTGSFTVSLDIVSSRDLTVIYGDRQSAILEATRGADCAETGVDYVASGTDLSLVVPAGSMSAQFEVTTCQDTIAEVDETYRFALLRVEDPVGAAAGTLHSISRGAAQNIHDDEPRVVVDAAVSVGEGASSVMVPVRLVARDGSAATSTEAVTVTFSTGVDNDAVHSATGGVSTDAARDYTSVTAGSVTIAAGLSSGSAEVALNDDTTVEDAETFVVTATAVSANAHLGGFVSDIDAAINLHSTVMLVGVVTIADNDSAVVNSPPVFVDADSDGTADPVSRMTPENVMSGDVGAPVTADDAENDELAYSVAESSGADAAAHLVAFNRDFELDAVTGQISVKADAVIDFEALASYVVAYQVTDGKDETGADEATPTIDDTLTLTVTVTNADEAGVVTFDADPVVGTALTAMLVEPDMVIGAQTWVWEKSKRPDSGFTDIDDPDNGSDTDTYRPQSDIHAYFLRATVTYADSFGAKTAESVTLLPVGVARTTLVKNTGGMSSTATSNEANSILYQQVETGDSVAGYVVTHVEVELELNYGDPITVQLHKAIGSHVADLQPTDSSIDLKGVEGSVELIAPKGTVLEPGTSYHLRLHRVANIRTSTGAADGASGWSIANRVLHYTPTDADSDGVIGVPLRLRVSGVELLGPPGPPLNVTAAPGDGSAELSWDPPGSTGHRPVESYQTRYKKTSEADTEFSAWLEVPDSDNDLDLADERLVTISGFDAGVEYTLEVRAVNSEGPGTGAEAKATPTETVASVLSVADVVVVESDLGSVMAEFTVSMTPAAASEVTVAWTTGVNGVAATDATSDTDFEADSGTLTFDVGDTSKTVTVLVTGDRLDEWDEVFTVVLSSASAPAVFDGGVTSLSATGTITDNDVPEVSYAEESLDPDKPEGNPAFFTVELDIMSSRDLTIFYRNRQSIALKATRGANCSATGADYVDSGAEGSVVVLAGSLSAEFMVDTCEDTVAEVDELFSFELVRVEDPNGDIAGSGHGTKHTTSPKILDDEPRVVVDAAVSVGEGASSVMVPVRLVARDGSAATSTEAVTVTFSTGADTAAVHSATAGTSTDTARDYTTVTGGTVTIPAGASSGSATVALNDDRLDEDPETFVVTATAVSANAHLGGFVSNLDSAVNLHSMEMLTGIVTITDNDTADLVLVGSPVMVAEEGAGVTFTVALATQPSASVTVTMDPTGEVELSPAGPLTFTTTNWETAQTITVTATDDADTADDTETIVLTAADGGYGGVTGSVPVTVTDNDTENLVLVGSPVMVAEEGAGVTFTVALATQPSASVTVTMDPTGEVELSPVGPLTFTTTNWESAQTVTVTAIHDNDTTDDTETIMLTAANGGYGSVTGDVSVTVTDNDTNSDPVFVDSNADDIADPVRFTVTENATPGDLVQTVIANDAELDTLTYSVVATTDPDGQTHLDAFNEAFVLDTTTGQIRVKANAVIDYETRRTYVVSYQVSDNKNSVGGADSSVDHTVRLMIRVLDVYEGTAQLTVTLVQIPDGTYVAHHPSDPYRERGRTVQNGLRFNEGENEYVYYRLLFEGPTNHGVKVGLSYSWTSESPIPADAGPLISSSELSLFQPRMWDTRIQTFDDDIGSSDVTLTIQITSCSPDCHIGTPNELTVTIVDNDGGPAASPPPTPDPPRLVCASVGNSYDPTGIAASWTAPTFTGAGITSYELRYRPRLDADWQHQTVTPAVTSTTITGLTPDSNYLVQLRAINTHGASPWSQPWYFWTGYDQQECQLLDEHTPHLQE